MAEHSTISSNNFDFLTFKMSFDLTILSCGRRLYFAFMSPSRSDFVPTRIIGHVGLYLRISGCHLYCQEFKFTKFLNEVLLIYLSILKRIEGIKRKAAEDTISLRISENS